MLQKTIFMPKSQRLDWWRERNIVIGRDPAGSNQVANRGRRFKNCAAQSRGSSPAAIFFFPKSCASTAALVNKTLRQEKNPLFCGADEVVFSLVVPPPPRTCERRR